MAQITIQCSLVASEATRQYLWHLMADIYTPFINEMLVRIGQHPNFEEWNQKGKIPADVFEDLRKALKEDPAFRGIPGRWYHAGRDLVKRIYKSWLTKRRRLYSQLAGQTHWLTILQSDDELIAACNQDLGVIRAEAAALLVKAEGAAPPSPSAKKSKKSPCPQKKAQKEKSAQPSKSLYPWLFEAYKTAETDLSKCAIAYLLKHNCQIPTKAEDAKKFQKRRRKAEIRVERIIEQLARTRLPKGRDLTDEKWLDTLKMAVQQVPKDEAEAAAWQADLLTDSSPLPFPIAYETNEDLKWSQNAKGRLCVSFNGLAEHSFEIHCDIRQLHWFQRFLDDQTIKKQGRKSHSAGALTLRSGRISWRLDAGKGNPWDRNRLVLFCSVDTLLWTKEGTEKASQEKASKIAQMISGTKAKGNLTNEQEDSVRKKEKTLALLQNPFPRPSRPLYEGSPTVLAGVSFGLDKPATLAIVDITTGQAIAYRSIRQLLGDDHKLLNRQRQRQRKKAQLRRSKQLKFAPNRISKEGLGDQIDSLIAKAIVQIAQQYNASSIVLGDLANIREIIESEVKAKAEQKTTLKEIQAKYALDYRTSIHRWSYNRLAQKIESKALQAGLSVETIKQPLTGSPQDKAREVAIAGFQARNVRKILDTGS
ncbi:type V CRISPR-associated protein Cas12k [Nodosilinea nodulosa]|uniref:type V CRISPR-associated protein Cas12k n=1 Tax=Nodosilinea nodulosa TaxID=416001 RepID=UPI0002F5611A|nr:type V CRISPR-associated protein Cas12k [Nodosilinea nodulosa]